MKCGLRTAILGVVLLAIAGYWFVFHSSWIQWSHQPLQYLPNMHRTASLKPQRAYSFFRDSSGARSAPEGSLAREQTVYKYAGANFRAEDVERFGAPVTLSRDLLRRGQFVYNNNCFVCHGKDGNGNGPVVGPFPNPPALTSDKIRNFSDSQIFHVITNGQNTMGSYAPQIREQDRWAIVKYVRVLQLANNPDQEDLRAFDEIVKGTQQ